MVAVAEMAILSGMLGLAVGEVHFYYLRRRERILKSAERLTNARTLLDAHVAAFDAFVNDPASPEHLKTILVSFGDTISNPKMAHECAHALVKHKRGLASEDALAVIEELDVLRSHRANLAQAFDVSVMSGFFYMLLRWPETAQVFEEAASRIAIDPTRGMGFVAKAAQMQASHSPTRTGNFGPTPAMAGV